MQNINLVLFLNKVHFAISTLLKVKNGKSLRLRLRLRFFITNGK